LQQAVIHGGDLFLSFIVNADINEFYGINKNQLNMKTYTEEELLAAIKYACEYQKATDYQTGGILLIVDQTELKANIENLLYELCDTDKTAHDEIELSDIFK
jgi:hypothetical protein